jgi:hypothetical protein
MRTRPADPFNGLPTLDRYRRTRFGTFPRLEYTFRASPGMPIRALERDRVATTRGKTFAGQDSRRSEIRDWGCGQFEIAGRARERT